MVGRQSYWTKRRHYNCARILHLIKLNKHVFFLFLCSDVKPSNVLINMQGQVKMCDFGISGYLVDSVAKTMDAGCKPYMAVSNLDILKIQIFQT